MRISPETARYRVLTQDLTEVRKNVQKWFFNQRRMREITLFEQRLQLQKERAARRAEHRARVEMAALVRAQLNAPIVAEEARKKELAEHYAKRKQQILTAARREWLMALQRCSDHGMTWTVSPDEWKNRRYSPDAHTFKDFSWYDGFN